MKILAIDTSTTQGSISLMLDSGEIITRFSIDKENYSSRLFRWLEEVKAESGLGPNLLALDAVAVSRGPGTFTGLRVGIATAKAMSIAADCPLFHFPTLETMAAMELNSAPLLQPMILAGRGEVYSAIYEGTRLIQEPIAMTPEEILNSPFKTKTLLFGNGTELLSEKNTLGENLNVVIKRETSALSPQLCKIALEKLSDVSYQIRPLEICYVRSATS